jgi:hypothetical protein
MAVNGTGLGKAKYYEGPFTLFLPFILKGLQKITPSILKGM